LKPFGPLEAEIMDILWSQPAGAPGMTVRDVLDVLQRHRQLAYTTVMTVLDNLYRKGWLRRSQDRRAWRYAPIKSHDAFTAEVMSQLVAASADPQAVFLHLVTQLSPEETSQLRAALRRSAPSS
jgi:predicted transcriptional regulator